MVHPFRRGKFCSATATTNTRSGLLILAWWLFLFLIILRTYLKTGFWKFLSILEDSRFLLGITLIKGIIYGNKVLLMLIMSKTLS